MNQANTRFRVQNKCILQSFESLRKLFLAEVPLYHELYQNQPFSGRIHISDLKYRPGLKAAQMPILNVSMSL